jgi:hypothetical protein
MFVSILVLTSCGGGSKTFKVDKSSIIDVNNNFTDYIKVIEKSYELEIHKGNWSSNSDYGLQIEVEFKTLKDCSGFEFEEEGKSLYLVPKDKNGAFIKDDQKDEVRMEHYSMGDYYLITSLVGNRPKVKFIYDCPTEDVQNNIVKNIAGFDIYVKVKPKNNGIASSIPSGSNNWDEILDKYESYITEVIALSKKVASGNTDVLTQYGELLENAEVLEKKLENAKDNLTPEQTKRLTKIVQKAAGL